MHKSKLDNLKSLVRESVKGTLEKSGKLQKPTPKPSMISKEVKKVVSIVKEALHVTGNSFVIKTEKLSKTTIEAHQNLYNKYVDVFNKVSSELDAANKQEAGSYGSSFRSFKMDECFNLNAVKLHELYFHNISDLASEIGVDSLPYIKLSRDYGTFENWQFDFMACAMSSREGWALCVYDPYKNTYMNVCVDGHTNGIPVGAIPVVVMDMWSHSFYKDYDTDKRSYLIAMMRELNWDVVEARMAMAEKSELSAIYHIKPVYNGAPESILGAAEVAAQAPIDNVNQQGHQVPGTTPPGPDQMMHESSEKED